MNKYVEGFREKIKPPPSDEPFHDAAMALQRAKFTNQEREKFFNEAFQDTLVRLFERWLLSAPHENKLREFLYNTALSLGEVKAQLIQYETYGANAMNHIKSKEVDTKE